MPKNIAINGFGRIGRLFFRQMFGKKDIDIVAINDLGDIENLAYLLKYDTVYGRFSKSVEVQDGNLVVNGQAIKVFQEKDPKKLPWKDMGVDIVVEATGVFDSFKKASVHIAAGAKRVVITAPAEDEDGEQGKTVLAGVNNDALSTCRISSNGSCTTNSVASIIEILNKEIGIEKALLTTAHGYTATQNLVDGPTRGSDFRRGRAAAQNIVPSSTGAATAVTRVIPDLVKKFDGVAMRVPLVSGSIADVTFLAKRTTSKEEVNETLRKASQLPRWKGIIAVTDEQLVSSDIVGQAYGAIVDLSMTRVADGTLVKVLSWYDNEWGYVSTLVKHVEIAAKTLS